VAHGDEFLTIARGSCLVVANLSGERKRISIPRRGATVLLATAAGLTLNREGVELPAESAAVLAYP